MLYSLVICTKNEEKNVVEFLQSVQNILLPPKSKLEVILVDDNSRDKSIQLAKSVKVKGLIILRSNGRGPAFARNLGVRKAKGFVIIFADCDAVFDRQCLINLSFALFSKDNPDAVQGNIWSQYYISNINLYLSRWREVVFKDSVLKTNNELKYFNSRLFAIKRSFLNKFCQGSNLFNEKISSAGGEDLECGKRINDFGGRIILAQNATIYHKDSKNFIRLVKKRFFKGYDDTKASVGQRLFGLINFKRAVIKPLKVGVPFWFSFCMWLAYTTGCEVGRFI